MSDTMPAVSAPVFTLASVSALGAELRAQARQLCQESQEVRAQSRAITHTLKVLRGGGSALGAIPARWTPTWSPPARLAIGGGASTEVALRDYIIATCLGPGDLELDDDEPLLANGILDSLGIMRLAVFIEETFGVPVPDEALVPEHFGSVRRVAALVERLEAEAPVRATANGATHRL